MIPLVNLTKQYANLKNEIDAAIAAVIAESAFIGTPANRFVAKFERDFAAFIGTKHAIGVANGTDAIEIALKALSIGAGDEVIVPALSWISTSEAVSNCGATPIFVDIHPQYYTMDPTKLERAITPKTKGIIPVHLYGLPAPMDEIIAIAKKHKLFVIEDCAQAHGAKYKDRNIGTFGDMATFSFFPGKNLGAYGDAGGIVTNEKILADTARLILNHGQRAKHEHLIEGRNSRLDGIQAAILSVKLPYLTEANQKRRTHAKKYDELLQGHGFDLQTVPYKTEPVYHLYAIQSDTRDTIIGRLKEHGIESAIHYPTPLPLLPAYASHGYRKGDFPVAERVTSRILSLPMFPELTDADIELIAATVISAKP